MEVITLFVWFSLFEGHYFVCLVVLFPPSLRKFVSLNIFLSFIYQWFVCFWLNEEFCHITHPRNIFLQLHTSVNWLDARIYENKCGTLDFLLSYMLSYIWICFQEILTGVHLEIILKVNHQWVGNWILQVSLPRDRVMHSITYFHIFLMKKFLSGRRYVKFLLSWHTTLCLFDKFTKSIWFHSTVMQ